MVIPRRAGIGLLAFAAVEAMLILFVDRPLSDSVRGLETTFPALIDFFRAITDVAKSPWYLWPSGFGIIVCCGLLHTRLPPPNRRPRIAQAGHALTFFFASIAVSGVITDILKPLFGRARPIEALRENKYGFDPFTFDSVWNSMPSGHATTAAALAAVLCILYPRGRVLWVIIGLVLAASRVMVNAHYLSDVVAGIAIGILTVWGLARFRDYQGCFTKLQVFFPLTKPRGEAKKRS